MQNKSNLPKNYRFNNQKEHNYNLRSKTKLNNTQYLIAQCVFDPIFMANHIYYEDEKKEILDFLLTSSQGNI